MATSGMFETFFQSHRLDRKDLLAAAVPAARIVWDKRGRIDRALQRKRFPIQRKAYKPVILTVFCLIGRHPAALTFQTFQIDICVDRLILKSR